MCKCHISQLNTPGLRYIQLPLSGGMDTDFVIIISLYANRSKLY
jgi:hypothetical protein